MPNNHLIGEKSPYLLQHAHNPVDWYPWGESAFAKARQEDRPVLLSVGYSTCHWCHVMAHESFEDETIAKIINDHFVAIKVDREERPDIDHIYMTATTAMTGQGGWPLTVFITPQGDPFYGGTYFPPYAKWGSPGFIDVLESIAAAWKNDRAHILSSSLSITEGLRRQVQMAASSLTMDETFLDRAYRQMRGQFDRANGGLGSAPKFPMGHNFSFLLRYYKRREEPEALSMVEKTLEAMAHGGIWDHLGGGFHRYSTDALWHVPHFEKMLYDQALLSRLYVEAYQVTGSMEHEQTSRGILDYVLRDMTDPQGGFYCAEDADSMDSTAGGHSKEGAFYVFAYAEILDALGQDMAAIFNYCYGVLPQGNVASDPHGEFKGKNILYRARSIKEAAEEFHRQEDEIQGILRATLPILWDLRNQRPRPSRDEKVLCDWNGLMMASFACAGRVLGEAKYTQAAVKAADFILTHMMAGDRLLHRWCGGGAGIQATLEDYAFLIYGLLEVHEATFVEKYLDAAEVLAATMIGLFAAPAGGFYMTASDAEALIIRPQEAYDGALPSGNSVAALVLLKLHALTKKEMYHTQAQALFNCFTASVDRAPYAHCFLLSALDWHVQGPCEITFKGAEDDTTIAKMIKVLYKYFIPSKTVQWIPAAQGPQAQICTRGTCLLPIDRVDVFEHELITIKRPG